MKKISTIIFVLTNIGSMNAMLAQGTEINYDRIGVGSNNSLLLEVLYGTPPPGTGMLAVGSYNQTGANHSVAIGSFNKMRQQLSLAVGHGNTVGSLGGYATSSVAVGEGNFLTGYASMVVGMANAMYYDNDWGGAKSSLIVGGWNYTHGDNTLIVGKNNSIPYVVDTETVHNPSSTTVLGSGLISRYDNCTVIGKNNLSPVPTIPPTGRAPLLVVGNGSSTSDRANAFEVFDNGDIIITKPQGDISMGIYGE